MRHQLAIATLSLAAAASYGGCSDLADDYDERCAGGGAHCGAAGGAGGGEQGGGGAAGQGGAIGGGGGAAGQGGEPGCQGHGECSEAANAQCDGGSCVPCTINDHCAGVPAAAICDGGTCVQCNLGDETVCAAMQSCDLLAKQCVDVEPTSVTTCQGCTNDVQCIGGHKCVPLDFPTGTLHGYYCLAPFPPSCTRPYVGVIGKESINGLAADNYCGVAEDLATCEAVLALIGDWHCTGTEGMCSQDFGGTEQSVPGAICRDLLAGASTNRCTYKCTGDDECRATGNGRFCGDESGANPPAFCGGDIN